MFVVCILLYNNTVFRSDWTMTWTDSGLTRNTLLSEKLNKAMLLVQSAQLTMVPGTQFLL
jgi:hypothetical protein